MMDTATKVKTHKDLNVWKNAVSLVLVIYNSTSQFPAEEKFGLTSQIRRAAISIPSNIAEGAARAHKKEYIQFLNVAKGSLAELETQIIISERLAYLTTDNFKDLNELITTVRKQLISLIKALDNSLILHHS